MSKLRKANFFYPGFEHAGIETPVDRALTSFLCHTVSACMAVKNAGVRLAGGGSSVHRAPVFDA